MSRQKKFYGVSGIYCILNTANDKRYIGQSINLGQRLKHHRLALSKNNHHCQHLQNAYNIYSEKCFVFHVIEKVEPSLLNDRENFWIEHFRSNHEDYGYNIRRDAVTNRGNTHTEDVRRRISAAHKGKKKQPESVEKSADTRRGIKRTSSQKDKISLARKTKDEQTIRVIMRLLQDPNLTVEEIAQAVGVGRRYVSRVKVKPPRWISGLAPAADNELPEVHKKQRKEGTTLSLPKKRPSTDVVREMLRLHVYEGWSGYKCSKHFSVSKATIESIFRREVQWVRNAGLYDEFGM